MLLLDGGARAANVAWTGGASHTGTSWSVATNWNTSALPAAGDSVFIPSIFGLQGVNVNYDYTGAQITFGTLNVNWGNSPITAYSATLNLAGNYNLSSNSESVGDSSFGGTKGYGVVNQSAGTNTAVNSLVLGNLASDSGTYNLSGTGILDIFGGSDVLTIGNLGTGTFNQSGGQEWDGSIIIAAGSGTGTYNLSDGSIHPYSEEIGNHGGVGQFVQTAGQNGDAVSVNMRLTVGGNGTYSLSGDSSTLTSDDETIAGVFNQSAGTHTVGSATSGSGYFLNVTTGSYNLSQTGALHVNGAETIGVNSGDAGAFVQTGGQHLVGGSLVLGNVSGSSGSYTLSGGTLSVTGNETIAAAGIAAFTHSAGSHTVGGNFTIGAGSYYALSGSGTLSVLGPETINGTFDQIGGTNSANNPNNLQQFGLSVSGTYHLDGGILNSESVEAIADGGAILQTAGTHTIGSAGEHVFLTLVGTNQDTGGIGGTYTLSNTGVLNINGSLFVGGLDINGDIGAGHASETNGPGVFNMQGGALTATDSIKIWDNSGTAFNFSGGTITTPLLEGPASRFNWTAGTLNYTDPAGLTVGGGQFFQTLTLNSGMAINTQSLTIATGGTFSPNGGALSLNGPLTLAGGTLSIASGVPFNNTAQISGYGTITGSGNFTNLGSITVPTGTLYFNATGAIANTGVISLASGTGLQFAGSRLENSGMIELAGGNHLSNISNDAGGVIEGTGYTTGLLSNNPGASLLITTGNLSLGQPLANSGTINLLGPAATLLGSAVTNTGTLRGDGTIANALTNASAGQIIADTGKTLIVSNMPGANSGTISLQGGTLEFTQPLINQGTISGRGVLEADGGLTNSAQVQLASSFSDVHGNVTNSSGGTIIITGNATANFYDNIQANSGSEFRVSAGSTAVFFGDVTGTSTFTGSGTKIFEGGSSALAGAIVTTGASIVSTTASLTAGAIRENALSVDGGHVTTPPDGTAAGVSVLGSLSISAGEFDLTNNKLIVTSPGATGTWNGSTYTGISGYVQSGRNGGSWNGPGIITTSAIPGSNLYTLGVARAGDIKGIADSATATFAGQTVHGSDTIVMYTYGGDANLDGKINIDDYGRIDGNVGQSGSVFGWFNGDFNYDGKINIDDYGIIDGNIGQQGAPIPTIADAQPVVGSGDMVAGVSAVPEPASLGLLILAGAGIPLRRRRVR